jgi:hypothetical protein
VRSSSTATSRRSKASGRDIPLYTRSWITRKRVVVPLARASNDFTVEIKYNGEQWGPPYLIAGGRVPGWASYSFEDYSPTPTSTRRADVARQSAESAGQRAGERWPDEPYKIVWQVRANGTHRIFPFYEPDWVRRTIGCMKIGTASGYTSSRSTPITPRRRATTSPTPRTMVRLDPPARRDLPDPMGRLGYDPRTPESVFEEQLERHYGKEVRARFAKQWKAASRACRPRSQRTRSARITAITRPSSSGAAPPRNSSRAKGSTVTPSNRSRRSSPTQRPEGAMAVCRCATRRCSSNRARTSMRSRASDPPRSLVPPGARREILTAMHKLRALSEYLGSRFTLAWFTASRPPTPNPPTDWKQNVSEWCQQARWSWEALGTPDHDFYKPFPDRLRMGTNHFHWGDKQLQLVQARMKLEDPWVPEPGVFYSHFTESPKTDSFDLECDAQLGWSLDGEAVHVSLQRQEGMEQAWLLEKPLPSSTFFHKQPMTRSGDRFEARIPRSPAGSLLAAEVEWRHAIHRVPQWTQRTPYLVVPAQSDPTPLVYSSQEALTFLKPESLDPAKHGLLLIATRAWDFHRDFDVATQAQAARRGRARDDAARAAAGLRERTILARLVPPPARDRQRAGERVRSRRRARARAGRDRRRALAADPAERGLASLRQRRHRALELRQGRDLALPGAADAAHAHPRLRART